MWRQATSVCIAFAECRSDVSGTLAGQAARNRVHRLLLTAQILNKKTVYKPSELIKPTLTIQIAVAAVMGNPRPLKVKLVGMSQVIVLQMTLQTFDSLICN